MDVATPGEHTKLIYDALNKKEAAIIAQLRTDIAPTNQHLHRIGARTDRVRKTLLIPMPALVNPEKQLRIENRREICRPLSYCLGGKSREVRCRGKPWDGARWKPGIEAVRATIHFVKATKRLATTAEGSLEPANPPGLPNTILNPLRHQ